MGLALAGLSVLLFAAHAAVFRDVKTLVFYLALDVVFVPVQVLLVSVIIERMMAERERQAMIKKLNMVVGAFFGEVGNTLVHRIVGLCPEAAALAARLDVNGSWGPAEYRAAAAFAESYGFPVATDRGRFAELRDFLLSHRAFILGLLQNPNLLEHERFTDLLWAICHLTEELEARARLQDVPQSDLEHLGGDVRRAFGLLVREWLSYMQYLRADYPYMYSLALRTNPFLPSTSPIVC